MLYGQAPMFRHRGQRQCPGQGSMDNVPGRALLAGGRSLPEMRLQVAHPIPFERSLDGIDQVGIWTQSYCTFPPSLSRFTKPTRGPRTGKGREWQTTGTGRRAGSDLRTPHQSNQPRREAPPTRALDCSPKLKHSRRSSATAHSRTVQSAMRRGGHGHLHPGPVHTFVDGRAWRVNHVWPVSVRAVLRTR